MSAGDEVSQKRNPEEIKFLVCKEKYQSQLIKADIKAQLRSGEFNQEAHFVTECCRCLFSLLEFSTSPPKAIDGRIVCPSSCANCCAESA